MSSQNSSSNSPSYYHRSSNPSSASGYSTPSPSSSGSSCSANYPMNQLSLSQSQRLPGQVPTGSSHHAGDIPSSKRQKRAQPNSVTSPGTTSTGPSGSWSTTPQYPGNQRPGGSRMPPSMAPIAPASSQTGIPHPPTELPPRSYGKGDPAAFGAKRPAGRIPESAMGYLPILEQRFNALEGAVEGYVKRRGDEALNRSKLPGLDQEISSYSRNPGSSSKS